jgi:hypothetical protein
LIGYPIGHHVLKLNHQSKIFVLILLFLFSIFYFFLREWKFLHPIDRNVHDEDKEEKLIEKKHMRYVIFSNCASFILGMGM